METYSWSPPSSGPSIADGRGWLRSSHADRMAYCRAVSEQLDGGEDASFYYGVLDSFYDEAVPSTLSNPSAQILALARAAAKAK
jgi:hypothetical protein